MNPSLSIPSIPSKLYCVYTYSLSWSCSSFRSPFWNASIRNSFSSKVCFCFTKCSSPFGYKIRIHAIYFLKSLPNHISINHFHCSVPLPFLTVHVSTFRLWQTMFGLLLPSLGYIFWTSNIWVPCSNLSVYVPIKHYLGFLFEAYMANIAIHQYVAFILM